MADDEECCDAQWDEEHQAYDHSTTCQRHLERCACGAHALEPSWFEVVTHDVVHARDKCGDPYLISEGGSGLFNPQLPPPVFGRMRGGRAE